MMLQVESEEGVATLLRFRLDKRLEEIPHDRAVITYCT
jgi:hypothetical protein